MLLKQMVLEDILKLFGPGTSPSHPRHADTVPGAGLHLPILIPRLRMVNGMTFTTSPPLTSRCHWCHLCLFVPHNNCTASPHCTTVSSPGFLSSILRPAGISKTVLQLLPNGQRWPEWNVCLHQAAYNSKIWSALAWCFFPVFERASTSVAYSLPLERNCRRTLTPTPKICTMFVRSGPSTYTTTSRAAGDFWHDSPVWCYPITGQYALAWRQQFRGIIK